MIAMNALQRLPVRAVPTRPVVARAVQCRASNDGSNTKTKETTLNSTIAPGA